jgi:hypothetical protein
MDCTTKSEESAGAITWKSHSKFVVELHHRRQLLQHHQSLRLLPSILLILLLKDFQWHLQRVIRVCSSGLFLLRHQRLHLQRLICLQSVLLLTFTTTRDGNLHQLQHVPHPFYQIQLLFGGNLNIHHLLLPSIGLPMETGFISLTLTLRMTRVIEVIKERVEHGSSWLLQVLL